MSVELEDDLYSWNSIENEYVMVSPSSSYAEVDFTLTKAMMGMVSMCENDIYYEECILPEETKIYVEQVIEPFKNRVRYFELCETSGLSKYKFYEEYVDNVKAVKIPKRIRILNFVIVCAKDPELSLSRQDLSIFTEEIALPAVSGDKQNELFGSMQVGIHYTPKDLGIDISNS